MLSCICTVPGSVFYLVFLEMGTTFVTFSLLLWLTYCLLLKERISSEEIVVVVVLLFNIHGKHHGTSCTYFGL